MDYADKILKDIKSYKEFDENDGRAKTKLIDFIEKHPVNLFRQNDAGHLTASAWIINQNRDQVLLHKHLAFDKWIQLGGHAEEYENLKSAALREAEEESGLASLSILDDKIFDIDLHKIPASKKYASHYHYDIRYLLQADSSEKLQKSSESDKLQWIALDEVKNFASEESVLRMLRKTEEYFAKQKELI